jgi:hypothetical protein
MVAKVGAVRNSVMRIRGDLDRPKDAEVWLMALLLRHPSTQEKIYGRFVLQKNEMECERVRRKEN